MNLALEYISHLMRNLRSNILAEEAYCSLSIGVRMVAISPHDI